MRTLTTTMLACAAILLPSAAHAQAAHDSAHRAMARTAREERREEARERGEKGEAHPAIRAAIRSLERAKSDLEHASHDFGGHRAEALRSVDEAIKQLRLALQYDKK